MIIEASFAFQAQIKKTARSKVSGEQFLASVPVNVRELSVDQAPIAFWWDPNGNKPRAFQVPVRAIDGDLYQPAKADETTKSIEYNDTNFRLTRRSAKADIPRLASADALPEIGRTYWRTLKPYSHWFHAEPKAAGEIRVSSVVSSDEKVQAIAIVEEISKFVVIDGTLYKQVDCPIYSFDRHFGRLSVGPHSKFFGKELDTVYQIDRFDEAKADWWKSREHYSYLSKTEFDYLRPDIVDASLITFNEVEFIEGRMHDMLMRHATDTYSKIPYLAQFPLETLFAFADMRDCRKMGGSGAALVQKMATFVDAVRHEGLYHEVVTAFDAVYVRLRDQAHTTLYDHIEMEASIERGFH